MRSMRSFSRSLLSIWKAGIRKEEDLRILGGIETLLSQRMNLAWRVDITSRMLYRSSQIL